MTAKNTFGRPSGLTNTAGTAHKAGVVSELRVQEGEPITSGATIAVISSSE